MESQTVYLGIDSTINPFYRTSCATIDGLCYMLVGVMVTSDPLTREISQEYEVTETQEVTVSNPSAIYIRLTVGF